MDAAVTNLDSVPLLNDVVFPQTSEAHPKVSGQGVVWLNKCLRRLEKENTLPAALEGGISTGSLLRALAKGASSTLQDAKKAAREGVQRQVQSVSTPAG